jgi:hypothetical protein
VTRGWVCRLQLLLTLTSAVILRSESHGTCDHILLSQIRDFPFRRLLRLAGSRWRYSTPELSSKLCPVYDPLARTTWKSHHCYCCGSTVAAQTCSPRRCVATAATRTTENTASNNFSIAVLQSFPWEPVCLGRRYPAAAACTCLLRICCPAAKIVSESFSSNGYLSGLKILSLSKYATILKRILEKWVLRAWTTFI